MLPESFALHRHGLLRRPRADLLCKGSVLCDVPPDGRVQGALARRRHRDVRSAAPSGQLRGTHSRLLSGSVLRRPGIHVLSEGYILSRGEMHAGCAEVMWRVVEPRVERDIC